jgi:hypothetical protein
MLAQVPFVPEITHFALPQSVWLARQTPPPLQTLPVRIEPTHDGVPHSASGSLPSTTKVQLPVEPATPDLVATQASQLPLQARSQQTPSAQWPLWHSASLAHAAAFALAATHVDPEHQLPLAQSALLAHVVLHAEPSAWHAYAEQALAQQTPETQWPLVHCPSAPHALPFAFFGAQALPLHHAVDAQSASALQADLHVVADAHA